MALNLTHLAAFQAVAAEKNFSRAAERAMVSQPALSKQVKALERALKVTLFERTPRGVRLTDAGELLADYAGRLFGLRDEAERAILELRGVQRGRLSIGASLTTGVYLLPEILVAYRRRHPEVRVDLQIGNTQEIQRRLAERSIDVGLTEGNADAERFDVEVFRRDELVPIARPGHPLLKKRRVTGEMLCREPFIVREAGSGTKSVVERALAERGLRVEPVLALNSTEAIKRAVAAGLGVAIVSRLAVDVEVKAKRLGVVRVADLKIERPLHRLTLKGGHRSAAVSAFLALMDGKNAS